MRGTVRRGFIGAAVLGSVLAGAMLWSARPSGMSDTTHDFILTDHHGEQFDVASQRGKVVLVFFGYSQCPDVCPTTLSKLSSVARRLGEQGEDMVVLYVTVDPERDTPEALKADLGNFAINAVGLTGSREAIDRVVQQYGAEYAIVLTPESAARYTVNHSTTLYVLDKRGRLSTEFPYEATADEITEAVRALM